MISHPDDIKKTGPWLKMYTNKVKMRPSHGYKESSVSAKIKNAAKSWVQGVKRVRKK